jgi:hypothetical protein
VAALGLALAQRLTNTIEVPLLRGYDAVGHVSYVFFLDLYRAIPYADQGWSYFHPPLHYLFGWLLAQAGSVYTFVYGLAALGNVAGLGVALLTAAIVRMGLPGRAGPVRIRLAARAGLVASVALLVCGAYYARNAVEFGTPFPMGGHRPVVDAFESRQPPGDRSWRDLVFVSPRLFVDPDPLAPHMLHSIWGTAYAGMWAYWDQSEPDLPRVAARTLLALGTLPTALAVVGFLLTVRVVWRDPDASVDTTLVLLTAGGLLVFAVFAFTTPTFAALKAVYLLGLSPAYAFFLARIVRALARWPALQVGLGIGAVLASVVGGVAHTRGVGLPVEEENVQMAVVRAHFGDWDGARALCRRELAALPTAAGQGSGGPRYDPLWLQDMLAAVELSAGNADAARALYADGYERRRARSARRGAADRMSPYATNRLAVATALAGQRREARRLLDNARVDQAFPEVMVNRAALRALDGDLTGAEADLRRALALESQLAPALMNLAWVLERRADPRATGAARHAGRATRSAPRRHPYGVGNGRGLSTQVFMLVLRDDDLELYRPARARGVPARRRRAS